MGVLSNQEQMLQRKKIAATRMAQLKAAYDTFVKTWETIEQEEKHLLRDVHKHIDQAKMKMILKKIDTLNT